MPDGSTLPGSARTVELVYRASPGKRAGKDGKTFVLSDETLDHHRTILKSSGWVLDYFRRNPIALFGHRQHQIVGQWDNPRIENNQLVAEFKRAAPGTSQLADEIASLVEQGILRACSVGFNMLDEPVPIDPNNARAGYILPRNELLEASLVGVGSNPQALSMARSIGISDETMSAVFGVHSAERQTGISPGVHAEHQSPNKKAISMNTISQRVANAQVAFTTAEDAYRTHTQDEDYDIDGANALRDEMNSRKARLSSLQEVELSLGIRAAEGEGAGAGTTTGTALAIMGSGGAGAVAPPSRRPLGIAKRELKTGDALVRAAVVHLSSYVSRRTLDEVLKERYPDDQISELMTRTAVAGATTTTSGWAAELVQQQVADFLSNLDPMAIFPRLAALGTQLTFGANAGSIKIPSRATSPSIAGSFVLEGSPIPVRRMGLTSITLLPHKTGVISYFSREVARYATPAIEGIIREGMRDDTAIMLDGLLLDATASSATRPAGLINGVSALTASTDGGFAAIVADLTALTAPFYAVNAGRKLVLLMNPAQSLQLMMAPGPDGTFGFGWAKAITDRFTILESTNVTSGNLYLVDAADFVSVNGTPEFDVSEQATIHAEDTTPLNIGVAGSPPTVAAPTVSMFQTANIALRMIVDLTWAMRRTGMVQYMTGVDWAPA